MRVEGKSKVGSTDNVGHKAGGGNVKVGITKLDLKIIQKKTFFRARFFTIRTVFLKAILFLLYHDNRRQT